MGKEGKCVGELRDILEEVCRPERRRPDQIGVWKEVYFSCDDDV